MRQQGTLTGKVGDDDTMAGLLQVFDHVLEVSVRAGCSVQTEDGGRFTRDFIPGNVVSVHCVRILDLHEDSIFRNIAIRSLLVAQLSVKRSTHLDFDRFDRIVRHRVSGPDVVPTVPDAFADVVVVGHDLQAFSGSFGGNHFDTHASIDC